MTKVVKKIKRVCLKRSPSFLLLLCYFLLLLQKKVTKEKETGKDNFSLFVRLLHRPLPATKQSEVRAFSGLPTHVCPEYYIAKVVWS
jgi:hypothetical protein